MTTVILEGEIVPKARPRTVRKNGRTWTYTPKRTQDFERYVKLQTKATVKQPIEQPLEVDILIKKRPPKSWSEKKQKEAIEGEVAPTAKPDLDNYTKAILDGMDGVAFKDDSYIVKSSQQKIYAETDGAEIKIQEVNKKTAY